MDSGMERETLPGGHCFRGLEHCRCWVCRVYSTPTPLRDNTGRDAVRIIVPASIGKQEQELREMSPLNALAFSFIRMLALPHPPPLLLGNAATSVVIQSHHLTRWLPSYTPPRFRTQV